MASGKFANVLVEPHQKHVLGQSDLQTSLHTLLDHLRKPVIAIKGSTTEFSHTFDRSLHLGAHKPKRINGGHARVFAPKIDMRESNQAYYIDIELPGFHDASSFTIVWRSNRELLVEGVLVRPVLGDLLVLDEEAALQKRKSSTNGFTPAPDASNIAPSYIVADEANSFEKNEDFSPQTIPSTSSTTCPPYIIADEANGFEKNEDFAPQTMWAAQTNDVNDADIQRRLREQANPFIETPSRQWDVSAGLDNSQNEDLFPLDIVEGRQLDEGDRHRVQAPTHHLPNGNQVDASQGCVSIGERSVGKFMRCFVFPRAVDVGGMRSEIRDGLLRIGVGKEAGRVK